MTSAFPTLIGRLTLEVWLNHQYGGQACLVVSVLSAYRAGVAGVVVVAITVTGVADVVLYKLIDRQWRRR